MLGRRSPQHDEQLKEPAASVLAEYQQAPVVIPSPRSTAHDHQKGAVNEDCSDVRVLFIRPVCPAGGVERSSRIQLDQRDIYLVLEPQIHRVVVQAFHLGSSVPGDEQLVDELVEVAVLPVPRCGGPSGSSSWSYRT